MTNHRIPRMGLRLLCGGGSVAGLLLGWTGAGTIHAQSQPPGAVAEQSATAPGVMRMYFNKSMVNLPIQVNEKYRAQIREVQLYVKEQPSAPWSLRSTVGPEQKMFSFHAPHEGEYAFTMVTVDKQGRSTPSDLSTEPPGVVVVIDLQAPQVELLNLGNTAEGQLIGYNAKDPNLDSTKVRLFYQGGDRQFRPLEPLANRPNVYCVPAQAVFTGLVRASAGDLAGNLSTRECQINQMPGATAPSVTATSQPAPVPMPVHETSNPGLPTRPNPLPKELALAPIPVLEHSAQRPVILPDPVTTPHERLHRPDGFDGPRLTEGNLQPTTDVVLTKASSLPLESLPLPTSPAPRKEASNRQLVSQNKVFLDYHIENSGRNLGKVEVWVTRDQGKTWQKHCEDSSAKSPVEVKLPEDGVYGLNLVVRTAGDTTTKGPAAGETPDWVIELDTTKPSAQITKLQSLSENGTHVVLIGWSAQDNNLGENAVELFYSGTAHGPWLPIAKGLKNEGQHRWTPPTSVGSHAFIRMTARDLAGNLSVSGTLEPIQLEEAARPRALIRGVRTESGSATTVGSNGN